MTIGYVVDAKLILLNVLLIRTNKYKQNNNHHLYFVFASSKILDFCDFNDFLFFITFYGLIIATRQLKNAKLYPMLNT